MLTQVCVDCELPQLVPRPDAIGDLRVEPDVDACRQDSQHLRSHGHILGDSDAVVPPLKHWRVVVHIQHQNGQINLKGVRERMTADRQRTSE